MLRRPLYYVAACSPAAQKGRRHVERFWKVKEKKKEKKEEKKKEKKKKKRKERRKRKRNEYKKKKRKGLQK